MFKFKKKEEFTNIASGIVKPLSAVPDQVFSEGMMGQGYAIELSDGHIYSPVSGVITMAFPTGHAYGITGKDGLEVLIHIGIDTVELSGEGLQAQVVVDQKIKQGDLLCIADLEFIKSKGKPTITPVIFTGGNSITLLKESQAVDKDTTGIVKID